MAEVRKHWFLGITPHSRLVEILKKHNVPDDAAFEALSEEKKTQIAKEAADNGITLGQESFEPRGFPKDAGWRVMSEYTYWVVDDGTEVAAGEFCETRTKAEEYVKKGYAQEIERDKEGKLRRISRSDWHSPSWLSTSDIKELVRRFTLAQEQSIDAARKDQAEMKRIFAEGSDKERTPEEKAKYEARVKAMTAWERFDPMQDHDLRYMRGIATWMETMETANTPCRIVFWFDN
jgi:hypothetical protein